MVLVHRLKGEPVFLNADLIETIEALPDTVVTLADGRRLVLSDDPEDVVDRIRRYRASIIVAAEELRETPRDAASAVVPLFPKTEG